MQSCCSASTRAWSPASLPAMQQTRHLEGLECCSMLQPFFVYGCSASSCLHHLTGTVASSRKDQACSASVICSQAAGSLNVHVFHPCSKQNCCQRFRMLPIIIIHVLILLEPRHAKTKPGFAPPVGCILRYLENARSLKALPSNHIG